jgi:hypothetical protein
MSVVIWNCLKKSDFAYNMFFNRKDLLIISEYRIELKSQSEALVAVSRAVF